MADRLGTARRAGRLFVHPAAAPLALLGGAVYLWNTNPHEPGNLLPRCPFNWLTGLLCPACGGSRMAYDLMHGDFTAAFHDNALLFVVFPLVLYLYGRWLLEGLRGRRYRPQLTRRGTLLVIGAAVSWAVVRNVV